jgi:hypothetical protein
MIYTYASAVLELPEWCSYLFVVMFVASDVKQFQTTKTYIWFTSHAIISQGLFIHFYAYCSIPFKAQFLLFVYHLS